ncbi:hypothetical protein EON79_07735 [bacterium]|nr:MAG: hypothetical protein EON79_07735 [bacterium]
MTNEIYIRAAVQRIEDSDATPMRKVRMLLKVARDVRPAARRLASIGEQQYRSGDRLGGARFVEASRRLERLRLDLRSKASDLLNPQPRPLTFGYAPGKDAYPRWQVGEALR